MASADWPVELRGITESIVTTLGPNERWNVAALGLQAPVAGEASTGDCDEPADRVTARTWGRTRTRRNFAERGEGYVQFSRDPVDFVDAALGVREEVEPILDSADAWARVSVERLQGGTSEGTEWVDWALDPVDASVERETVPTVNRGFNAVVEATVAASRLGVDAYDDEVLRDRLEYFESVVRRCGSEQERVAFDRLRDRI